MYKGPFQWWVQSVMPLVFDDSLSYYEVLAKLTKYIEGLTGDVQEIEKVLETIEGIGDVTEFTEFLETIQNEIGNISNLQTDNKSDLVSAINELALKAQIAYYKQPGGIPESDLSQEVKDKLNRTGESAEYIINNKTLKKAPNNNSPADLGLGTYSVPDGGIPWDTLSQDVRDRIESGGGGTGGTKDYTELINKPEINGHTLNAGNNTAESLGLGTYTKPNRGIPESDLSEEVQNKLNTSGGIAESENSFVATRNYEAGELIYINGVLYKTKYKILSGTNLTPGNNIEQTDISSEIEKINSDIEALQSGSGPDSWSLVYNINRDGTTTEERFFEYFNAIGGENYLFICTPNPTQTTRYQIRIYKKDGTLVHNAEVTNYQNQYRFTFTPVDSGEYYCTNNPVGGPNVVTVRVELEYTESQGISELWEQVNKASQIEPRVDAVETLISEQQNDVDNLRNAITAENSFDILNLFGAYNDRTHNGVDFTAIENGFIANRTSSSASTAIDNIYNNTTQLPPGVVPGSKVFLKYECATADIGIGVAWYSAGSMIGGLSVYYESTVIDVPANAEGAIFRAQVLKTASPSNSQVRVWLYPSVYNNFPYQEFKAKDEEIINNVNMRNANLLADSDLDLILDDCFWLLNQNGTYEHRPDGTSGAAFFSCSHTANSYLQVYIPFNPTSIYLRRKLSANAFTAWRNIIGGNNYNNEYTFNEYTNSYEVTATPSITTDTNNYLAATGDTTDVTNEIVTMLETTGICNLGSGKFYVSGINMPIGSTIKGCGDRTQIVLIGDETVAGYAIKMNRYCIIENVDIAGIASTTLLPRLITLPETIGERHGILWQGNYTENPVTTQQPSNGKVSNVYIHGFTGGGITCYDTGSGGANMINADNVDIFNCYAGINIAYLSEFNKFTNIKAFNNKIGCINNGGNNVFANCDFSNNVTGFVIDNSAEQSPNSAHGTCVGCVFNHSGSNTGVGIRVLNIRHGFIFDACQIFFSQIYIENSDGVVVSNSNFGSRNCSITVNGGGVALFNGNVHQSQPDIAITNNDNVHFVNCFVRDTGAIVSAS